MSRISNIEIKQYSGSSESWDQWSQTGNTQPLIALRVKRKINLRARKTHSADGKFGHGDGGWDSI